MKNNILFTVDEGLSFTVTTRSKNVKVLKEASEKYHVDIPDAKYILVCNDEQIDYYHELVGYGVTEFAFGIPTDSLEDYSELVGCGVTTASPEVSDRLKSLALTLLENNLDNMYWGNILEQYLCEMGIDYED